MLNSLRKLGVCPGLEIEGNWSSGLAVYDDCGAFVLTTGAYRWPTAIAMVDPARVLPDQQPANWKGLDLGLLVYAFQGAKAELDRIAGSRQSRLSITVTGRLDVRLDSTDTNLSLDPFGEPFGFGAQNRYPAQLVVVGIKKFSLSVDNKIIDTVIWSR